MDTWIRKAAPPSAETRRETIKWGLKTGKCNCCGCIPRSLFEVVGMLVCMQCMAELGDGVYPENCYINTAHPDYEEMVKENSGDWLADA